MTAIVGIAKDGVVWLGGDSAGSDGHLIQSRSDPKVFVKGEFIFGFAGSFRIGQVLQYIFEPPVPETQGIAYMIKQFVPKLRDTIEKAGASMGDDTAPSSVFIVGHLGVLYEIEEDYQVARFAKPYHACGSGDGVCLGSLHSTEGLDMPPMQRISMALEAASEFCLGVKPPFTILSVGG
jgi:ATP-dependent protease HslVU (ClpYQ) peptidase subunit